MMVTEVSNLTQRLYFRSPHTRAFAYYKTLKRRASRVATFFFFILLNYSCTLAPPEIQRELEAQTDPEQNHFLK